MFGKLKYCLAAVVKNNGSLLAVLEECHHQASSLLRAPEALSDQE